MVRERDEKNRVGFGGLPRGHRYKFPGSTSGSRDVGCFNAFPPTLSLCGRGTAGDARILLRVHRTSDGWLVMLAVATVLERHDGGVASPGLERRELGGAKHGRIRRVATAMRIDKPSQRIARSFRWRGEDESTNQTEEISRPAPEAHRRNGGGFPEKRT